MITLERLQSKLLLGLDTHFAHLVDFTGEHCLGSSGRVNAVGLDRDEDTTTCLQEERGVITNDTGLIRLSDVGKDDIHHWEQLMIVSDILTDLE